LHLLVCPAPSFSYCTYYSLSWLLVLDTKVSGLSCFVVVVTKVTSLYWLVVLVTSDWSVLAPSHCTYLSVLLLVLVTALTDLSWLLVLVTALTGLPWLL